MYNNHTPDKVFQTTPQRSLEDTLKDTVYDGLSTSLHYVVPVAAGLMIGSGILSADKSVVAGVTVAVCSGYIQSLNYTNDFVHSVGDSELVDGLQKELNLRRAIGFIRGVVEGGAILVASGYAGAYFQRALDLAK